MRWWFPRLGVVVQPLNLKNHKVVVINTVIGYSFYDVAFLAFLLTLLGHYWLFVHHLFRFRGFLNPEKVNFIMNFVSVYDYRSFLNSYYLKKSIRTSC